MYNLGNKNEVPILTDVTHRIESKLVERSDNNLSGFTSKRSELWIDHLNIYWNQPVCKILFGGNLTTSYGFDKSLFYGVAHQELIDMLLNFGILGTFIFMSFYVFNSVKKLRNYFKYKAEEDLLIVMIKYVWLFYAFSLTMFPAWGFYIFFLI